MERQELEQAAGGRRLYHILCMRCRNPTTKLHILTPNPPIDHMAV
jgi:hypothetical protein